MRIHRHVREVLYIQRTPGLSSSSDCAPDCVSSLAPSPDVQHFDNYLDVSRPHGHSWNLCLHYFDLYVMLLPHMPPPTQTPLDPLCFSRCRPLLCLPIIHPPIPLPPHPRLSSAIAHPSIPFSSRLPPVQFLSPTTAPLAYRPFSLKQPSLVHSGIAALQPGKSAVQALVPAGNQPAIGQPVFTDANRLATTSVHHG